MQYFGLEQVFVTITTLKRSTKSVVDIHVYLGMNPNIFGDTLIFP